MKTKRRVTWVLVVLMALSVVPGGVRAESVSVEPAGANLVVTADNLDGLLFSANNSDVLTAMNNVMAARDRVNIARSELLPSINLNALMSIGNGPMFLLNSVTCLVPFLFPGKWFDLKAAKKDYQAEVTAFHLTRLNAYAAAYTLIERVGGDQAILGVLDENRARLSQYVNELKVLFDLGVISQSELLKAQIELSRGEVDSLKMQELVATERATLKKLLGLSVNQDFTIGLSDVAPSDLEKVSIDKAVALVLDRAPERIQLDFLMAATKARVHSAAWAFLSGCSGNQGSFSSNGGLGAFMQTGAQLTLGYGIFPQVKLAKRAVRSIEIRKSELPQEFGRSLESALDNIRETLQREKTALASIGMAENMYQQEVTLFQLGKSSVKEVLDTLSAIASAKVEAISARIAADGHRVTLKRLGIEDKFLDILVASHREFDKRK